MNQPLQGAFNRAAALPPEEQDRFAKFLLADLEADQLFDRPESDDLLIRRAIETLAEHRAGAITPLDPADL